MTLKLSHVPGLYAICRLEPEAPIPAWGRASLFYAVTRTSEALSLVCEAAQVPETVKAERGWRLLKVEGPLDFALTGVLASLSVPLARAGISIFAISTYDTDYILVRDTHLTDAVTVLKKAGCIFKL